MSLETEGVERGGDEPMTYSHVLHFRFGKVTRALRIIFKSHKTFDLREFVQTCCTKKRNGYVKRRGGGIEDAEPINRILL